MQLQPYDINSNIPAVPALRLTSRPLAHSRRRPPRCASAWRPRSQVQRSRPPSSAASSRHWTICWQPARATLCLLQRDVAAAW